VSERSFFNIRYNFPGYAFLLFIILICFKELNGFISESRVGLFHVFFVFFYLLSGACIGFLVSQVWYKLIYHGKKMYYFQKKGKPRSYMNFLHKKFRIREDDVEMATNASDFIYHHHKNENLRAFVSRRWDLYQTMGCTQYSILLGIGFGLLIKIYLFKPSLENLTNLSLGVLICENIEVIFFIIIGLFIYQALNEAIKKILKEHDDMVYLIFWNIFRDEHIRECIKKKLPCKYFECKQKEGEQ